MLIPSETNDRLAVIDASYKKTKAFVSVYSYKGEKYFEAEVLEAMIVFIISGKAAISYDASGERVVGAGEMFFIPSYCKYNIEALEDTHSIIFIFHINSPLGDVYRLEDLLPYCDKVSDIYVHYDIRPVLAKYLENMDYYLESEFGYWDFYALKKSELVYILFNTYTYEELAGFFYPIIAEDMSFREFVRSTFLQAKNVQELAGMCNYSTSGFIKKFRRYFNESPYKWMQREKSKHIFIEILQHKDSLKNIASKYGFSSYQHFSSFCKQQYGLSPSEISKTSKLPSGRSLSGIREILAGGGK